MDKTLHTKFGTAKIGKDGYYEITSSREGNHKKKLHRLIFEDYWQIDDINDFFGEKMDIHHIDGNKLNNELNNLEPIPHAEHAAMHQRGRKHSSETKHKMSESHKGEKNHMYGKTHSTKARKKISEANKGKHHTAETRKLMSEKRAGVNNPRAKYTLWNIESIHYDKGTMFNKGREPNPIKCFQLKYGGKKIPIGGFHDFKTVEIISNLISSIIDEEEQKRS